MNNKTLLVVVVALFVGIGVIYFGSNLSGGRNDDALIDKTANEVIRRLRANYTPGPYAPGLDPDKIDPKALSQPARLVSEPPPVPARYSNWSDAWEAQRR